MTAQKNNYFGLLSLLTSLFFIWGFVTCLNDILIPHLKSLFFLNYTQVMLVQFCFFAAYLVMSVPSGYFVDGFGYQKGIVTGLLVTGLGCLLFYPAAEWLSYPLFLFAFFVLASGITLLQVAANPYVTILGPPETASSRLTLTQAFNSLGTTVAPFFGSFFILTTAIKSPEQLKSLTADALNAYQTSQAASVQGPYLGLAACLLLISLFFALIKLPKIKPVETETATRSQKENRSAWHYRHLVLGAVAIFVYVGAEVAIGSFLISYLGEPEVTGLSAQAASKYVSWYWGGAMVGRFIGATVMRRIPAGSYLAFNAMAAFSLIMITMNSHGFVAMWSVLAVGLFNSIMFPTIFSLAISGLGQHTGQGSGILCAAIVGGAVLPVMQGVLADYFGIQWAFVIPALCYCYIAFYGYWGCRFQSVA